MGCGTSSLQQQQTLVDKRKEVLPDWLPTVPEEEREDWPAYCRVCDLVDHGQVEAPTSPTPEGMLTYTVLCSDDVITHVIYKPTTFGHCGRFDHLDDHAAKVPSSLIDDFTALVTYLIGPARTELDRVRVLYAWVTCQDVSVNTEGATEDTPGWYLHKMRESESYYHLLFSTLCSHAGVRCQTIRGYAKTADKPPNTQFAGTSPIKQWTAVCIDGRWGIVDTRWGSRDSAEDMTTSPSSSDDTNQHNTNEFYFLPHPAQYLSTCFPEDPDWQLVLSPIEISDFETHVQCWPHFFAFGLSLLSHHRGEVQTTNGQAKIYIGCNEEDIRAINFAYSLTESSGSDRWEGASLDRFVLQQKKRDAVVFSIQPPHRGEYLLEIFVGSHDDKTCYTACEYLIVCDETSKDVCPLPDWPGDWGPGSEAVAMGLVPISHPASCVRCKSTPASIEFSLSRELDFLAKLFEVNTKETRLRRYVAHEVADGTATFHVMPPKQGTYGLAIYAKERGQAGAFAAMCSYLTIAEDMEQDAKPFPDVPKGSFGPVQPSFLDLGLRTVTHHSAFVDCESSELDLRLSMSRTLQLSHQLSLENDNDFGSYVFRQVVDDEVQFLVRFPKPGRYRLAIFAEEVSPDEDPRNVFNYCISCTGSVSHDVHPFPDVAGNQWGERYPTCKDYGIFPASHPNAYIETTSGELEIKLESETHIDILHLFQRWKEGAQPEDFSQCVKAMDGEDADRVGVRVSCPHVGEYSLELFARMSEEEEPINVFNYFIGYKEEAAASTEDDDQATTGESPAGPSTESPGEASDTLTLLGLSKKSHPETNIMNKTGELLITFGKATPLVFSQNLNMKTETGTEEMGDYVFRQVLNDEVHFRLRFPTVGVYNFSVSAGEVGGTLEEVIKYTINCTAPNQKLSPYPDVDGDQWGLKQPDASTITLKSHPAAYIKASQRLDIVIESTAPTQFQQRFYLRTRKEGTKKLKKKDVGDFGCHKTLDQGKKTVVVLHFPREGDYTLQLSACNSESQNVINYLIYCDMPMDPCIPFPTVEDRRWGPVYSNCESNGFTLNSHEDPFITSDNEEPRLSFGAPKSTWLRHTLVYCSDKGQEEDVSSFAFTQADHQDTGHVVAWLRLPSVGFYRLTIHSRAKNETVLVNYLLDCKKPMKVCLPWPEQPHGWPIGWHLFEPRMKVITAGKEVRFSGIFPNVSDVAVILPTGDRVQLNEQENSKWKGTVTIPVEAQAGDTVTLGIVVDKQTGKHQEVLRYIIEGGAKEAPHVEEGAKETSPAGAEGGGKVETPPEVEQPEDYRAVLKRHKSSIAEVMIPREVIKKFEEEGIINESEASEMDTQLPVNTLDVNKSLLKAVMTEGEDAFVTYRDMIEETGQKEVLELIKDVVVEPATSDTDNKIKKKMKEAMKSRNRARLKKLIEEYKSNALDEEDDVFKEAVDRLELLDAKQGILDAINERKIPELEQTIAVASVYEEVLQSDLQEARTLLESLRTLERLRHDVMSMDERTLSEIKRYKNPPPEVQTVMKATLRLLGDSKKQTKNWRLILIHMGKTGLQSLNHRVGQCEPESISPETAAQVKKILQDLSLESVRDVSTGAATYYVWAMGMIKEVEGMKTKDASPRPPSADS
ncbi:uncharacterized protein LOC118420003 [Branchiostoma floridae]|uniref:Uncharacterized protein LOC118420003 n=1 Tax=Branchiostoma floridae TaxID=7739 RepID=A0A9J7LGT4_BRAFL|nr:uncharacterized protein LOC118420003 [Branchiostoma floridae]